MEQYPLWIAGRWEEGDERLVVASPYDGAPVGETAWAGAEAVERAIAGAASAREPMAELSAYERSEALRTVRRGLERHRDELATLMAREAGKPVKLAAAEVDRALFTVRTAAEEALRFGGDVLPLDVTAATKGHLGILQRFPIGPVLAISPFNFPLNLAMHKVAAAIASGNPIVLKPTPKAPLTWLFVARLLAETDLPPGAVSVLVCSNEMAGLMVEDERFKMLSFTGSAAVGWSLKARAGMKRVTLELGGNAGAIVDEEADLPSAAKQLAASAFAYAGQSCISAQRIFVDPHDLEEFTGLLVGVAESLHVGDPLDPETDVGPMIDAAAVERVQSWVNEAVESGARLLTGGRGDGSLYYPTVLAVTPPDAKVCAEEVFAPVVNVLGYASFSGALDQVNASVYGLQASLFSRDLGHILAAFRKLEVGGLIVNGPPSYRVDSMPYGGVKTSGLGREGLKYAMEEMTEPRLLVIADIPEATS